MSKKITTEEFIKRSKEIHGDLYSYKYTEYKKKDEKVIITCQFHGDFTTTPSQHISKRKVGCPHCSKKYRRNTEDFINDANKIHNFSYIYDKCIFTTTTRKVEIYCPIHGYFWQTPKKHLKGQGCPICKGTPKKTTEQFIIQSKIVHGDLYAYYKVNYKTAHDQVIITCPFHGDFLQVARVHLRGHKCPICMKELTNVGYNEGKYFKPYLTLINEDFICQYEVRINKHLKYYIDFYFEDLKIAIEYDEMGHKYRKLYDERRQKDIENKLKCKFVRIDDKSFMEDKNFYSSLLENELT